MSNLEKHDMKVSALRARVKKGNKWSTCYASRHKHAAAKCAVYLLIMRKAGADNRSAVVH